jgi:hypothetical protein
MRALARAFFDVTNPTEVRVELRLDATPAPDRLRRHGPPFGVTSRTAGGIVRCAAPGEIAADGQPHDAATRFLPFFGPRPGGGWTASEHGGPRRGQSPWEERAHRVGNDSMATTDSSAEQGLEAGCSSMVGGDSGRRRVRSMWGFASANRSTDFGGNGTKATAAVMRYGCWRGEPYEGSCRRGKDPVYPDDFRFRPELGGTRGRQRDEPRGRKRGATNPLAQVRRKPSRW